MSRNVNANYSADSIQSLEILEAMRTKQGMYFGCAGVDALHHGLKEMISNSIDEAQQGYGNKIIIKFSEDLKTVCVRDFGRGVPHEKITEVCTVPHSSGKLRTGESAYDASGGLHG